VLAIAESAHLRDSHGGILLYVLALPVAAVLLVDVARDHEARRLMILGLSCLAAALALHELGPPVLRALGWRYDSWGFQVKIALKESVEFAGWLLVAFALALQVWPRRAAAR
jgi:hypothetical protein